MDSLPANNVSVLIGHDFAGAQVAPNLIVSAVPTLENNTRKFVLSFVAYAKHWQRPP